MFITTETRLDVGFNAAQDRLAELARDGLLGRASAGAYGQWQASLVQAGPQPVMLGMYRIARVRVADMVTHGDSALCAVRWEVSGGGMLVPALDADIKLVPAGPEATVFTVSGICRPPLAKLTSGLDPAVTHEVAQATLQAFASRVAGYITDPATVPGQGEMAPGPGYCDRVAS